MVKHLQLVDDSVSSGKRRVSFKVDATLDNYTDVEEGFLVSGAHLQGNEEGCDIERLLKVMHSLRIDGGVERFAEISKMVNAERSENSIFGGGPRSIIVASDVNLLRRKNECLEKATVNVPRAARDINSGRNDASPAAVEAAKEVRLRVFLPPIDTCKNLGLSSSTTSPSQSPIEDVKVEVSRSNQSVLLVDSVEGLTNDDYSSPSSSSSSSSFSSSCESTAADDTGSGASSRRGSGDSLHGDPCCRGYSNQRRHGRKDSLGTVVDFTRLIPTLVSDNEDFRHKEYQRQLSAIVQPIELQQNTW